MNVESEGQSLSTFQIQAPQASEPSKVICQGSAAFCLFFRLRCRLTSRSHHTDGELRRAECAEFFVHFGGESGRRTQQIGNRGPIIGGQRVFSRRMVSQIAAGSSDLFVGEEIGCRGKGKPRQASKSTGGGVVEVCVVMMFGLSDLGPICRFLTPVAAIRQRLARQRQLWRDQASRRQIPARAPGQLLGQLDHPRLSNARLRLDFGAFGVQTTSSTG